MIRRQTPGFQRDGRAAIGATFLCLTLAGCTADECMQHWLAWRNGNGPYSAVCPADRAMDRYRQQRLPR
jgi:hypothetical protein